MGYHESFTLYPRKTKKGKIVYYYRLYGEDGKRASGKSTGQTTKTAARAYVTELIKNGQLNLTKKDITFEKFAENWWLWDKCEYLKRQKAKGKQISQSYASICRGYLKNHILPYFKDYRLSKIKTSTIEKWLMELYEDSERDLSPTTINHCLTTLKIMLKEATWLDYITKNPAEDISQFKEKPKEKSVLTLEEVRTLLDENTIDTVWDNDIMFYTINLLAASTGMRMGEVQALKVKNVHEDFVVIQYAWTRKYGLKEEPKWKSFRAIPIPSKTSEYLQKVIAYNNYSEPEDFVFHGSKREKPIDHKKILHKLYDALHRINIDENKRKDRNICFHSWRYFFNTVMRNKIPDFKLQKLTGHKTEAMTDHYTNFDINQFQDVKQLQEGLFSQ